MSNASRSKSNEHQANRTLVGAIFGAAATVVALTGAVAIADTPRQLSTIAESLVSTEVFEIMPPSWIEAPPSQALAPANGVYEDSGLAASRTRSTRRAAADGAGGRSVPSAAGTGSGRSVLSDATEKRRRRLQRLDPQVTTVRECDLHGGRAQQAVGLGLAFVHGPHQRA